MIGKGVGSRLIRKEDDRYMRGRGQFVADIRLPGMKEVAFVRSPVAHAHIRGIRIPDPHRGAVFTAEDLAQVKPISAVSGLPGFKISDQPALAAGKVRQVGELVAMCLADSRAQAEDIAASVTLEFEELPAVHDMLEGRKPGAPLLHEHWGDNVFLETFVEAGDWSSGGSGADQRDARGAHGAPMHGADRGQGRGRVLGQPPRAAHRLQRDPDAAHRAHRPVRLPRPRARPGAGDRARRRRRLRLQGHSRARGGLRLLARATLPASGALDRGSARAPGRQRQLPRASLPHHRRMPTATAGCSASSARRRSIRAPIRPTRSPPAWRPRRSRASCLARTTSRPIAAAPSRSRPTSARSCPIAGWRAPASASRSS